MKHLTSTPQTVVVMRTMKDWEAVTAEEIQATGRQGHCGAGNRGRSGKTERASVRPAL